MLTGLVIGSIATLLALGLRRYLREHVVVTWRRRVDVVARLRCMIEQ
jgi:hypothetical protein